MTTRNFRVNNGLEVGDITLSASTNKITGLATSAPSADGDVVTKAYRDSGTQTMTNKTLTSPTIATPTILGTATVGAITTNVIASNGSNAELSIQPSGTGDLLLQLGGSTKFQLASGGVALTGGAAANITALSDGATITIDMATACHHSVTLGGNRTFAAPSNQVVGQAGSIFITQDGTGSRTAAFNSAFKFVGGTAPTLTTGAGLTDRIDYIIKSSNVIHCAVSLDVK